MRKTTSISKTRTPTAEGRTRTPNGVDQRLIGLRLMPDEREAVEHHAAVRKVSRSAFARQCFLRGLDILVGRKATTIKRG